jgi:hypothetical protein
LISCSLVLFIFNLFDLFLEYSRYRIRPNSFNLLFITEHDFVATIYRYSAKSFFLPSLCHHTPQTPCGLGIASEGKGSFAFTALSLPGGSFIPYPDGVIG